MIAGLDSSFDRPTPAQAAQAYAAGVRVWGGYIGVRPRNELGLAVLWSQADFDVIRNAGMTPIGFCSGWDDPGAIRDKAASWGVLLCVDVESGIRNDGPWIDGWLEVSGAGLYGNASVHFETGQPIGRGAAFNIVSGYFGYNPQATWEPWLDDLGERPANPCGWQWWGGHSEFGIDVDRAWFDDWFGSVGANMTADQAAQLAWLFQQWNPGPDPAGNKTLRDYFGDMYNKLGGLGTATVDVNALAAALAPQLPGYPPLERLAIAEAVMAAFKAQLNK